jgi:ABC-type multidrug transport system ATPase subunit
MAGLINPTLGTIQASSAEGGGAGAEVSLVGSSSSFVPQEDVLFPLLTVRENVMHAGRVRLPRQWSDAKVAQFVDLLLADLGLSSVLHSVVGDGVLTRGISGGERKRTSIGVGMAAAPAILLVDEPTSGLDATAALQVCLNSSPNPCTLPPMA